MRGSSAPGCKGQLRRTARCPQGPRPQQGPRPHWEPSSPSQKAVPSPEGAGRRAGREAMLGRLMLRGVDCTSSCAHSLERGRHAPRRPQKRSNPKLTSCRDWNAVAGGWSPQLPSAGPPALLITPAGVLFRHCYWYDWHTCFVLKPKLRCSRRRQRAAPVSSSGRWCAANTAARCVRSCSSAATRCRNSTRCPTCGPTGYSYRADDKRAKQWPYYDACYRACIAEVQC
eukprot:1183144-Prorocentrum_minimum.AAC.1